MADAQAQPDRPSAAEATRERALRSEQKKSALARARDRWGSAGMMPGGTDGQDAPGEENVEDEEEGGEAPLSPQGEEGRYTALRRAQRNARRLDHNTGLSEADAPNPQAKRTRPLGLNTLGGDLAERQREQQLDADAKDSNDRLRKFSPLSSSPGPMRGPQMPGDASQQQEQDRGIPLRQAIMAAKQAFGKGEPQFQLPRARKKDENQEEQEPQDESALSLRNAVKVAKKLLGRDTAELDRKRIQNPARGANLAPGASALGGLANEEQAKKMIGTALVKASWATLWLSFGHSVYALVILFFSGWASKYIRQYVPEVGREWFPGELGKRITSFQLLPLKLGEITAMAVLTLLVFMLDFLILGIIGFILGLLMDGARVYNALPFT